MTTTMPDRTARITLGVDTHKDVHVAAALDELGRLLGTIEIPTTTKGSHRLLRWAEGFGQVVRAGVEGTGCYGDAALRSWVGRIADTWTSAEDVYVFFNNDPRACAVRNAARFSELAARARR